MIKVGFIGVGGIAKGAHLPVVRDMGDAEVVSVCDVDGERANGVGEEFKARAYTDYREMLEAEDLDAIYICVPPFAHGDIEFDCIAKGLPMFIEKPVALDLKTASKILTAIEKSKLVTQVGYVLRNYDTAQKLQELLRARQDQIALFSGRYWGGLPGQPWWKHSDGGGGQVIEQATHLFDFVRFLLGEVEEVHGRFATRFWGDDPEHDIEDVSVASLRMKNGAIGSITCTTGAALTGSGSGWLEILTHDLAVLWKGAKMTLRTKDGEEESEPQLKGIEVENRAFIDAVQGKPSIIRSPYRDAVRTLELTLAIVQSAQTGEPVKIS